MATSTWIDGNGSWTVNGNWSTGSFPNSSSANAAIVDGTSAVTLSASVSVDSLRLAGGNVLDISSGSGLTVDSRIINAGAIQIAAGSNNAALDTNGPVSLTGGGTVSLSDSSTNQALIAQSAGGSPLTNVDNTIQGFGQIGGATGLILVNQGTVDANVSGQTLTLGAAGSVTNSNLLEATNLGILAITANVSNAGGTITANGGTVAISNSAAITAGTLTTSGGGLLESVGGAETLSGVTISSGSTYTMGSGSVTQLVGTITNAGTMQIAAGSNNAALDTNGPVSLTGGGTVSLSDSSTNQALIAQSAGGSPLTNVDNTIQGSGQIGGATGLILVNQGTVDANVSGQTLTLGAAGSVTNSNLLEATNLGILAITTNVTNAGGTITANGGTVAISNSAAITAGTLTTSGGGLLESVGGAETLSGVTISSGSTYTMGSGSVTQLVGTITNAGTMQIAAGSNNAGLDTNGPVSLTGGGTVSLSDSSTNQALIAQSSGGSPLTNVDNTIQGSGQIGGATGLILVNQGTVDANASGQTLTLGPAGSVTNSNFLEATNFGILAITTNVTNTGGTITADGGTVAISNSAAITGGTLTASGGGVMDLSAGDLTNLSGGTLTGGVYAVDAGSTLQLSNNAKIVTLAANLTLSGAGSVVESLDTATSVQVPIESTLTTIAAGGTLNVTDGRSYTTASTITDTGALQISGGGVFTAGELSVTSGAVASVGAVSSLDLSSPMSVSGTLINAGTVSSGGATAVMFATTSADRLILDPGATFTGTVVGGGAHTTLELDEGAGRGTLDALGTAFINFGTVVADAGAAWTVEALASALAGVTLTGSGRPDVLEMISAGTFSLGGVSNFPTIELANGNNTVFISAPAANSDVLTGGSGTNTLVLTSAGTFSLGGVSNFRTIELAPGNNTVTVTDTTLSGGSVTIEAGASGNETINVVDTAASKGTTLAYVAATGKDRFTGGFENDTVYVSAAALAGDTLTGGSGINTLKLTSAGAINLAPLSTFSTIDLSAGSNTVDASAAEVSHDTLVGGGGSNALVLTTAGTVNLGGVSDFANVYLAAGTNTVTVTGATLSGGSATVHDGASGTNSVSAAGDTAASKGKTLSYVTGSGPDSFTGGFENDTVYVSATAVSGDTLTGGSGSNTLVLTNTGTFSLGGVSKFANVYLAAGNNTVTVTDTALSAGAATLHDGASGTNSVSAAGDTTASKGKILYYVTGAGPDSFTGGFENDTVYVSAAAVGGDTLTGGTGADVLVLTTAGAVDLDGVSRFPTMYLAAGTNSVTVADTTLSGGTVTFREQPSSHNSISAAGDTAASKGKALYYIPGTGTDSFTGGFENDTIYMDAGPALVSDIFTGGSGTNAVVMVSAGTVDLDGVSKFANVYLTGGNSTVTVTDTTLSGGAVAVHDGPSGNNSVSAAGDTAASKGKILYYFASKGNDSFIGGFENDTVYAGSGTDTVTAGSGNDTIFAGTGLSTFTAGGGSDKFVFMADNLPTQTLDNFRVGAGDLVVYGVHATNGFDLGSTDNGLNPLVPTAIDPSIFTANASGSFASASQRFAYDTTNGDLFYSATGSNASERVVAALTGAPSITTGNILFEH